VSKIQNKFMDVHKMCIYIPLNIQNQIQKTHGETKKRNCYVNSMFVCFVLL
jgi:hypothetical protein